LNLGGRVKGLVEGSFGGDDETVGFSDGVETLFDGDAGHSPGRGEMANEGDVLGASDEQLGGGQIVRIQCANTVAVGNRDEAFPPAGRQGLEDGIAEDIDMIAMAQMKGPRFTERLMDQERRGFIKGLRAEVGVIGGGEGL
jgi:hypothetical protein